MRFLQPAEPLPMGSIGEDANEIVALRPADQRFRLIKQRKRARKCAHLRNLALDHERLQTIHDGEL